MICGKRATWCEIDIRRLVAEETIDNDLGDIFAELLIALLVQVGCQLTRHGTNLVGDLHNVLFLVSWISHSSYLGAQPSTSLVIHVAGVFLGVLAVLVDESEPDGCTCVVQNYFLERCCSAMNGHHLRRHKIVIMIGTVRSESNPFV
eukprot:CAMPEP_0202715334 /NCGR_PEP_ID=MMETSP1385-20130828/88344_1 /ASSEMBLY_ACC=CAM_ASM_000861 /TAXON_ID=933848 /ORGANISM="Elphidium margaritaceum" /LENGTH=146 /DNA_ID=CAMNT_0049376541 /DNA_START=136 /DNA_END=576 /DNA_ORIENTATION=-